MLGNNFGKGSKSFGGGKNIWHSKVKVYPVGGTVANLSDYAAGSVIPAGSIAVLDTANASVTIVSLDEFSSTSKYAVGDVVVKGGIAYVCDTAISTAGEWDATDWTELSAIAEYSSSATYSQGDLVKHEGKVYKNKTAIGTGEEWTAAKWTECAKATAAQGEGISGLTQHDVYVDAEALDSTYGGATVSVVYEGVLFTSRLVNPIPDAVLAKLPGIISFKEA